MVLHLRGDIEGLWIFFQLLTSIESSRCFGHYIAMSEWLTTFSTRDPTLSIIFHHTSHAANDSKGETSRLKELLHAIDDDTGKEDLVHHLRMMSLQKIALDDDTGKEDLVHHLRMMSLQKIALDNGYNKLVLGSCASRIACHVISATVKVRYQFIYSS
uniref:Uncharacterized protein n=1 Tax=Nelumbo nucifera TaxID=4432 RepID=A0A822ZQP6_NELNU|nr:TPA_asm: hypothetical protein HUJ06_003975 [Nelumbo nucifera]